MCFSKQSTLVLTDWTSFVQKVRPFLLIITHNAVKNHFLPPTLLFRVKKSYLKCYLIYSYGRSSPLNYPNFLPNVQVLICLLLKSPGLWLYRVWRVLGKVNWKLYWKNWKIKDILTWSVSWGWLTKSILWLEISQNPLTYFSPMFFCYNPWKRQKAKGFWLFQGVQT